MLYLKAVNWEDIEQEYLFTTEQPTDENGFTTLKKPEKSSRKMKSTCLSTRTTRHPYKYS